MDAQDYLRILQARWRIVIAASAILVLVALGTSLATTPIYQAYTRLFISTSSGGSVNESYTGNLLSQQRVASYAKVITGATLAERTVTRLGLEISPSELASKVRAGSSPETVLIDVTVQDPSPERARDIANALSDEFVILAAQLETPNNGRAPAARVIVEQYAGTPSEPVVPKTKRNLALGLAVGLLLGIALAVLRDRLDNTIKERRPLEELAGAGLVGAIPFDKDRQKEASISFAEESSGGAEAYRELRTNLHFLEVDNPPRAIVVTSSMPGEGKTTTAINIALVLAEAGHSVAVVEGDMRRPRLSKYLGIIGDVGLSTVLSGQAVLDDVLQPTQFAGLQVLASGPLPPNPSELLGSMNARNLMDELRQRFDYVIIDASPLLPVTDATVLTTIADGALIIARYGKTKRDQVARAVGNLNTVGGTILGVVITMTPKRGRGAYEYRYYYDIDKASRRQTVSAAVDPDMDTHKGSRRRASRADGYDVASLLSKQAKSHRRPAEASTGQPVDDAPVPNNSRWD